MGDVEDQVFFHLTGTRRPGLLPAVGLRPALFARLTDLTQLRYDHPLVLVDSSDAPLRPLSQVVDGLIADVAPKGAAGERMRRDLLRVERELRVMLEAGASGTLSELWHAASERLAPRGGAPFAENSAKARANLPVDGALVACDAAMPAAVVRHVWRVIEERKAKTMRARIDALALRLADLVTADHLRSAAGRTPEALRKGVGAAYQDAFDFEIMARLLSRPSGAHELSDGRRRRIDATLAVLRGQRFFTAKDPLPFAFPRVSDALAAYRERSAAMAELVRAMAIAELELRGAYVEAKHDDYFASFGAHALTPADHALFPDYLVLLDGAAGAEDRARIIEGLTSGAPVKIVCTTDDAFGLDAQLATTAMGLGDAFVLQSSAARLYGVSDHLRAALAFRGPALLSVFVGSTPGVTPYLVSAAATDSRAFPTFAYDPAAGVDWAHRFTLADAPAAAWSEHELQYADGGMQRVTERVAFTLADFALCDPRCAGDLAVVPHEHWGEQLTPLASFGGEARHVPFVYAVDASSGLHKVIVDDHLTQLTRRSADAWKRLVELDDLKRERIAAAAPAPEAVAVAAAPAPAPAETAPEAPAAPSSDEPYIETPRCTTCNECTNLDSRVFAYNENKQAFLKDAKAATYRILVEAAENCQVAIIHPGKPRDPNEPGLAELIERAAPFR